MDLELRSCCSVRARSGGTARDIACSRRHAAFLCCGRVAFASLFDGLHFAPVSDVSQVGFLFLSFRAFLDSCPLCSVDTSSIALRPGVPFMLSELCESAIEGTAKGWLVLPVLAPVYSLVRICCSVLETPLITFLSRTCGSLCESGDSMLASWFVAMIFVR